MFAEPLAAPESCAVVLWVKLSVGFIAGARYVTPGPESRTEPRETRAVSAVAFGVGESLQGPGARLKV
jgi:hypothetical protein